MRLERSLNTKRNIIAGEIDKIVGIICPFIVRTLIIKIIGIDYLGLTSHYYSILQMLNLVEMGFGTALVYSMYAPIAQNRDDAINALIQFYKKIYRILGLIVILLGIAFTPFLRMTIKGDVPSDINIHYLYLIYLLNAVVQYYVFPERKALLSAFQKDSVTSIYHAVTQLFMYILQAVFVVFSKDYYLYALMLPVSSLIYSIIVGLKVGRMYPQYKGKGKISGEELAGIKKQTIGLLIRKIAMLSRNSFDAFFVSLFLGLHMSAIYANYYYIMDSVIVLLAVVKTSMAGGVGNSVAMETKEKNLADMNKINFLFMWLSGWCGVCLLCLYRPFMLLWVGKEMTLGFGITVMFALYFYILKMSDIRTLYSEAAGIWWQARYISVLEGITNLVLNIILTSFMGLYGIILATMISYLVFNFGGGAFILFGAYFSNGRLSSYMLSHLKYLIVFIIASAVTYSASYLVPYDGILGLLITGLLCLVIPNIVYFVVMRKDENFTHGIELIKRLVKR